MFVFAAQLTPRWRDLPALARLGTRRLAGPIVRIPVLGPVAMACAHEVVLLELAASRLEGRLAANRRSAVVAAQPLRPARPVSRALLRVLVSFASLVPPLLAACALGVAVTEAGAPAVGLLVVLVPSVLLMAAGGLAFAVTAPALRGLAPVQRRAARRWAHARGLVMVEAVFLAASESDPRAATVLVRHCLAAADAQDVAVAAYPRDARVAGLYRRLGFAPITPGATLLVRPPRSAGVPRPSGDPHYPRPTAPGGRSTRAASFFGARTQ
jgi:hypothetical protein